MLQAVLPPTAPDRWPLAGGLRIASTRRQIGLGAALLVHACIIFAAVRIASPPPASAPELPGMPIVFARPSPAVTVPVAAVSLPAPRERAQAKALAPHVAPRFMAAPAAPHLAALAQPAATVALAPAAAPTANVPAENPAELGFFEARLDEAVRAAATMPQAARQQHRTGGARVHFRYLDGAVDDVRIIESSQSRLLDDAAITAVRVAHYPVPPPDIRGRRLELLVRIDFRMDG